MQQLFTKLSTSPDALGGLLFLALLPNQAFAVQSGRFWRARGLPEDVAASSAASPSSAIRIRILTFQPTLLSREKRQQARLVGGMPCQTSLKLPLYTSSYGLTSRYQRKIRHANCLVANISQRD